MTDPIQSSSSSIEVKIEQQPLTCPSCPTGPDAIPVWLRDRTETWIECDNCDIWYHAVCVNVDPTDVERIENYVCSKCAQTTTQTTTWLRTSTREHSRINYADLDNGDMAACTKGERGGNKWKKLLEEKRFTANRFKKMRGSELTLEWVKKNGFDEPIIIEDAEGLDMVMPGADTTVSDIAVAVGLDHPVDVIDVSTQQELQGWTMESWAAFFEDPNRTDTLNVISLEVSDTPFASQIVRPRIVRELDWIENVWPRHLRLTEYPKVQLYCLMSVKDSYTDFHIDFGGTSVFYHIIRGEKNFYFIEPTPKNMKRYESWISSPDQSLNFFADFVKECQIVKLKTGSTMIIPTGWIHAVFTPADSIVIGGNFLHSMGISGQLRTFELERRAHVPLKYRFPYFERMIWYAGVYYCDILKDSPHSLCSTEIDGLTELTKFLRRQLAKLDKSSGVSSEERKAIRNAMPDNVTDPSQLTRRLQRRLNRVLIQRLEVAKDELEACLVRMKREREED